MDVQYQRCSRQIMSVAPQSLTLAYMYMEGWTWLDGDKNKNFSHSWVTIFSYPLCSMHAPLVHKVPLKTYYYLHLVLADFVSLFNKYPIFPYMT